LDKHAILVARGETSSDVTSTLVGWKEVHKLRTALREKKRTKISQRLENEKNDTEGRLGV
jgi:hypothetical protein